MLDPSIAARVRELEAAGVATGDAIGRARWERDHADEAPGYFGVYDLRVVEYSDAGPPYAVRIREVYRVFCATCIATFEIVLHDRQPVDDTDSRCDHCGKAVHR